MWGALLAAIPALIGTIANAAKDDPAPPPQPKPRREFQPMQRPAQAPMTMPTDPGSQMGAEQPPAELAALQRFRRSVGY